jgi:phosphatidylglycerol:prolipoprotein diacylglycerol transferase
VFPAAWAIGRLGCTLAHDHPGIHTSASNWLAFAYPDGPRWDLGFLEMLFSIALTIATALLWRKPRPLGTYISLTCLAYAPVRFALDFLRLPAEAEGDARYAGLTPAQWASFVLLAVGLGALWLVRDERGRRKRAQVGGSDARCLESDRSHSTPRRRSSAA